MSQVKPKVPQLRLPDTYIAEVNAWRDLWRRDRKQALTRLDELYAWIRANYHYTDAQYRDHQDELWP